MSDKDRGHVWKIDDDLKGEIDIFAFEVGFHNGPECVKCGYVYCHHGDDGPQEDCKFIDQLEMLI